MTSKANAKSEGRRMWKKPQSKIPSPEKLIKTFVRIQDKRQNPTPAHPCHISKKKKKRKNSTICPNKGLSPKKKQSITQ